MTKTMQHGICRHSLLVVQLLKNLREKVVKPMRMTDLFRHTTIEALARSVSGDDEAPQSPDRGKSPADAWRPGQEQRRRG